MVDRITPQTSNSERQFVEQTFGVADKWPVLTEPYCQWTSRTPSATAAPRCMRSAPNCVRCRRPKLVKTRMLNGTHIALACLATLAGYQRTDEAMRDGVIFDYVEQLMRDEIQPLLPAVPGMNTPGYRQRCSSAQQSPDERPVVAVGSTGIEQVSSVLPSLQEAIAQGRPHTLLMLAVAGWARYMRGPT